MTYKTLPTPLETYKYWAFFTAKIVFVLSIANFLISNGNVSYEPSLLFWGPLICGLLWPLYGVMCTLAAFAAPLLWITIVFLSIFISN